MVEYIPCCTAPAEHWCLLPASRLASRNILIEQNIKKRTGPALLCTLWSQPRVSYMKGKGEKANVAMQSLSTSLPRSGGKQVVIEPARPRTSYPSVLGWHPTPWCLDVCATPQLDTVTLRPALSDTVTIRPMSCCGLATQHQQYD